MAGPFCHMRGIRMTEKNLRENALTTLEDMLEFMGMDGEDTPQAVKNNIIRLINAASSYIEAVTGRKFRKQRYTEKHFASGYQELCVDQYPVISVESVRDDAGNIVRDFEITGSGEYGVLFRDQGWGIKGYRSGLADDVHLKSRYLTVEYTAGYVLPKDATQEEPETLPYDLQMIVWQIVQQQWGLAKNGANGLAAFSISDVSWTFDKELGAQVQDIINCYKRTEC